MPRRSHGDLASFVDELQAKGMYWFLPNDAKEKIGNSNVAIEAAIRRLRKKGRLVVPRKGFIVIVPLEHRIAGSPPATWFIDDLMNDLDQPSYVGLLSAAEIRGAAHQRPMVFQVITDRPNRPSRAGRNRIEFHMSSRAVEMPATREKSETGTFRVSTPEATALDLVRFTGAAGGLSNVATVLTELSENMTSENLLKSVGLAMLPEVQRLGYLLELVGSLDLSKSLHGWLANKPTRKVALLNRAPRRTGTLNERWKIIENVTVEPDV
jgi:predicted transcriptional regulator of viral defense system